jgi:serine/threonine protein kinase
VVFVQLKHTVDEKEGRAFLLHARMLGQLQHPGLLPLHDMGVHDDRYFYAFRVPPGKSLQELMRQSNNGATLLKPKSRHLIHLLSQIVDTVSYLHQNGVTIGRIFSDSIYIGNFREVIIKDFSKAQKFEDLKSEGFLKARSDDLQCLAQLGMRMWFLSPEKEPYSIREWDQIAQNLPIEFQEVLDKACLERGGRYPNTQAFNSDLQNILQDKPPSFREGDMIFTLRGQIQKNKSSYIIFIILSFIFFITLATHKAPLGELQKNKNSMALELKKIEQEIEHLNQEIEKQNNNQKSLLLEKEALIKRTDRYLSEKTTLLNEEKKLLQSKKEDDQARQDRKINKDRIALKRTQLENNKKALIDEINKVGRSTPSNIENTNLSSGVSIQDAGDFICESLTPRVNLVQLPSLSLEDETDWLSNYAKKPRMGKTFMDSYVISKKFLPENFIIHPLGDKIVWTSERQFNILEIQRKPLLKSFAIFETPKALAFNGPLRFLSTSSGKIVHWALTDKGFEKTNIPDTSSKDAVKILPNSKISESWIGLGKNNNIVGLDSFLPTRILKAEDLQKDVFDNILAYSDHKLILLPSGKILLSELGDVESWKTMPFGGLVFLYNQRADIYKINLAQDQPIIKKIWSFDLPQNMNGQSITSLAMDDLQNRVWVSLANDSTYLFDKTRATPLPLINIIGQVILYNNDMLISKDNFNLYCYNASPFEEFELQLNNNGSKELQAKIPEWLKGQQFLGKPHLPLHHCA